MSKADDLTPFEVGVLILAPYARPRSFPQEVGTRVVAEILVRKGLLERSPDTPMGPEALYRCTDRGEDTVTNILHLHGKQRV